MITRRLQVVAGEARRVDLAAAQRAAEELLRALTLTTFPNDEGYDELVVVRDIPFQSLFMHHLLPFHGVAHIAYLPAERIIGLGAAPTRAHDPRTREEFLSPTGGRTR